MVDPSPVDKEKLLIFTQRSNSSVGLGGEVGKSFSDRWDPIFIQQEIAQPG